MMLVLTQYWEIGAHTSPRVRSGPKFNFDIKKLKLKLNFNMKSAKFEIELRARTTVIADRWEEFVVGILLRILSRIDLAHTI